MKQGVVEIAILQAAVELIRAAAEDNGQPAAGGVSELGGHSGGVGLHFGNRIDARSNDAVGASDRARYRLFGAESIQVVAHRPLALSVQVESVDYLCIGKIGQDAERELLQDGDLDYDTPLQNAARNRGFGLQQ